MSWGGPAIAPSGGPARDVGEDPAVLDELTSQGYMSTPVTRIGEHWVAGFRRNELERLL